MENPVDRITIDHEDSKAVARGGVENQLDDKKKEGVKVYLSKGNMKVVLAPGKVQIMAKGGGQTIRTREVDTSIIFKNCMYETADKKLQRIIEKDPRFGVEFFWHPAFVDEEWEGRGGASALDVVKTFDFAWKDRIKELDRRHTLAAEFDEELNPREGFVDEDPLGGHPGVRLEVTEDKSKK